MSTTTPPTMSNHLAPLLTSSSFVSLISHNNSHSFESQLSLDFIASSLFSYYTHVFPLFLLYPCTFPHYSLPQPTPHFSFMLTTFSHLPISSSKFTTLQLTPHTHVGLSHLSPALLNFFCVFGRQIFF